MCSGAADATAQFHVTHAAKTSGEHPQFGVGFPRGFAVDGVQGAALTLQVGETYEFVNHHGEGLLELCEHPLVITNSSVGGSFEQHQLVRAGVVSREWCRPVSHLPLCRCAADAR